MRTIGKLNKHLSEFRDYLSRGRNTFECSCEYVTHIDDLLDRCDNPDLTAREICQEVVRSMRDLEKLMQENEPKGIVISPQEIAYIRDTALTHLGKSNLHNTQSLVDILSQNTDTKSEDFAHIRDLSNPKGIKTNIIMWDLRNGIPDNFIDWYNPAGVVFTEEARLPKDYFQTTPIDWNRVYSITTSVKEQHHELGRAIGMSYRSSTVNFDPYKGTIEHENRARAAHTNYNLYFRSYLSAIQKEESTKPAREQFELAQKFAAHSLKTGIPPQTYTPKLKELDFTGQQEFYVELLKKQEPKGFER